MSSKLHTVFGSIGLVAALWLAPACSSRPAAFGDGGDASGSAGTTGTAGTGGATGAAGTTGTAGTTGAAGATGTAGSGGTSGAAGAAGTGRGGGGGAAGAAGSGGSAGAGSAGTTGTAGSGGTAGGRGGTGGSGGRGGAGGAGGSGGRGGTAGGGSGGAPGPECATASDCMLFTDCCFCKAVPAGEVVASCPAICIQSACMARGLPPNAVACVAGRCVAGFACDDRQVTCRLAPPTCPAGEVPAVDAVGTCYTGACAPATECVSVDGCGACTGADETCVNYQTQRGSSFHCVTIPPACNGNGTCSCIGPGSCIAPNRSCSDFSGIRGILCSCPNC